MLVTPNGAVPAAAIGLATIDASGHISRTEGRSVGGGYGDETLSGTLSVNADCMGSITLNVSESGQLVRTSVLSVVFVDNQQGIRMVQKSLTLPNNAVVPAVITVDGRKTSSDQQ